jgi:transcriptional regulator with XRE-family HTH domain
VAHSNTRNRGEKKGECAADNLTVAAVDCGGFVKLGHVSRRDTDFLPNSQVGLVWSWLAALFVFHATILHLIRKDCKHQIVLRISPSTYRFTGSGEARTMICMNTALADLVRRARAQAGLTQEELAEAINRSTGYIGILETGKVDRPKSETLRNLAAALGVPLNDLVATTGQIDAAEEENLADVLQRITSLPSHQERLAAYDRLPDSVRQSFLRAAQDYLVATNAQLGELVKQSRRGR